MTTATVRATAPARWLGFVNAVFPLPVHVTYGVLWALAYEAAAVLTTGEVWRPAAGSVLRAATVIALLFYVRLVDERMDEAYDRVHNPDRPLVTGLVTVSEVRRAGWLVGIVVVLVNAVVAPWSAVVLVFLVVYAEVLSRPDSGFAALRDRPLLHLAVAYPVQLAIGFYLYASCVGTGVVTAGTRPAAAVLVFALAFLHYEIARKTVRDPAPRAYSATFLGPTGSGIVALVSAFAAAGLLALVTEPWNLGALAFLPYVALLFPVVGAIGYRRRDSWSKTAATLFLIVLYAALVVSGVTD